MKKQIIFVLSLILSLQVTAQSNEYVKFIKQSWALDSFSGLNTNDGHRSGLPTELNSISMEFNKQGKVLMSIKNELVLMDYDISKGSKGSYLNFSGFIMLYAEIKTLDSKRMILKIQMPKGETDDALLYFSPKTDKLSNNLIRYLAGGYILSDYNEYASTFGATQDQELNYLRLDSSGGMSLLFDEKDSGSWSIDMESYQLNLQGKSKKYSFKINNFYSSKLNLSTISGAPKTDYNFRKSPFFNFDQDEIETELKRIEEVEMEAEAATEAVPEREISDEEFLCKSWKAYSLITAEGNNYDIDNRFIFYPDGSVYYSSGKKKYKGTWKLDSNKRLIVLNWGKKEEVANYRKNYFYSESYQSDIAIIITFTPPKSKEVISLELREEEPK